MKDIDYILEKYFEGETSLQEEKMLREYFGKGNIAERHKEYSPMFEFFAEERISSNLDTPQKLKRIFPFYILGGVAASLLTIILLKFTLFTSNDSLSGTLVYIDGKRIYDTEVINTQALESIENVSDLDQETIDMQISILDSFTN